MNTYSQAIRITESVQESSTLREQIESISGLWPAFSKMIEEGSSVVLKIDGERQHSGDQNIYTIVVSGGNLKDDFFHKDSPNILDVMSECVIFYNEKVWNK